MGVLVSTHGPELQKVLQFSKMTKKSHIGQGGQVHSRHEPVEIRDKMTSVGALQVVY